jgi:hypothetical protein
MKRTLLVIAVTTALASGALAFADTTTIHDPAGDSLGGPAFDIRRAVAGHANGRLEHVVVVEAADGFTKRETFVFLRAEGTGYVVGTNGVRQGTTIVGPAHVDRQGNRIVFRFDASSIGSPGRYRWQVFTAAPDEKPFDQAPDSGRVTHNL